MKLDTNLWPPPFIEMSVNDMAKLKSIAQGLIEAITPVLIERCGKVGHQWDRAEGRRCTLEGSREIETSMFGNPQYEDYTYDAYVRTCTRCGKREEARKIVKEVSLHPFTNEEC